METVNHVLFCTDSQGFIAINDPDLLEHQVFFTMHSPGYVVPKDELGFHGMALQVKAGITARVRLERANIAERLYRHHRRRHLPR